MKASLHGPNRRKNRVVGGDNTLSSVDFDAQKEHKEKNKGQQKDVPIRIRFKVRSLEKYLLDTQQQQQQQQQDDPSASASFDSIGNYGLFTLNSRNGENLECENAGRLLLERHLALTSSQEIHNSDPVLIHFHSIPIFVLGVKPVYTDSFFKNDILYLSQTHCHNHKVCEDTFYDVTCCSRPSSSPQSDYDPLSVVQMEVHFLRYNDPHSDMEEFHAGEIAKQLMNHTLFSVLTVNECFVVTIRKIDLVCRVSRVQVLKNTNNSHDGYEKINIDDSEQQGSIPTKNISNIMMEEPYRGRVTVATEFYIQPSNRDAIKIHGERILPEGNLPEDVLHVTTSDGEWFPVRKILLAPCIHLTRYVQAGHGKYQHVESIPKAERSLDAPETGMHCKVDVDCCTFDRVLIFLMSQSEMYPKEYKFALELSEMNSMFKAAEVLGLMSLKDLCISQLSSFESRVKKDKYIRLSEVKLRNANDELLIILDGMVLDITRWIDEHPGGASIIPTQALNMDCSCFFEMYHVSRQSFLYLKSFYIGELHPADRAALKKDCVAEASVGFLQSLQSFTDPWRVQVLEHVDQQIHQSL